MADSSKTEKATPKKRRDERKKGNVFLSQDAVAVVTLLGSFAAFWLLSGTIGAQLSGFMRFCLSMCAVDGSLVLDDMVLELVKQGLGVLVRSVLPITLVTITCAIVATFAQTRMLVSTELIRPKLSKISPIQGFKRLFSLKSVINALKGLLKICLLMIIVYLSLKGMFDESAKYLHVDLRASCAHLFSQGMNMIVKIGLAFIVLAAVDFFYQRWDYERGLRMSKQELKEEYKQTEGDPQVKGKIRERQQAQARQRMMQKVPGADVVIRNPTHYAVALKYDPERNGAPVVVAKGADSLALRIVAVAQENGVFITENKPLARGLYETVDLDREIPDQFYQPVAEVLAFVYSLKRKGLNEV